MQTQIAFRVIVTILGSRGQIDSPAMGKKAGPDSRGANGPADESENRAPHHHTASGRRPVVDAVGRPDRRAYAEPNRCSYQGVTWVAVTSPLRLVHPPRICALGRERRPHPALGKLGQRLVVDSIPRVIADPCVWIPRR
jgi:hypothetical protein